MDSHWRSSLSPFSYIVACLAAAVSPNIERISKIVVPTSHFSIKICGPGCKILKLSFKKPCSLYSVKSFYSPLLAALLTTGQLSEGGDEWTPFKDTSSSFATTAEIPGITGFFFFFYKGTGLLQLTYNSLWCLKLCLSERAGVLLAFLHTDLSEEQKSTVWFLYSRHDSFFLFSF